MNILGLIPARAGSKGVPGKNLMELGGRSLLARAVRTAAESRLLSRAVVSTEDDGLANEARNNGGHVPFVRPASLATDTAGTWDVVRHAVDWLEQNEDWHADAIVVLQPTTPFRTAAIIDTCIETMIQAGAPACITVRAVDYPPQWMYRRSPDGVLTRYRDDVPWPKRRQDAEPLWQPNGMVYVLRRELLDEPMPLPVAGMVSVEIDPVISINIDEPIHARLAEMIWETNGHD